MLVLVTLVLAATLLVQLSSASLRKQSESLEAQAALQTKWARLSCERAALSQASLYFEALEQTRRRPSQKPESSSSPLSQTRQEIMLGSCRLQLLVADESAKANLNSLAQISPAKTHLLSKQLIEPRYVPDLKPFPSFPLRYLGDVVDMSALNARHGNVRVVAEVAQNVSIWSQSLNIHRASDRVLREAIAVVVPKGRADSFVESLRDSPNSGLATILRRTIKNKEEQNQLTSILSDRSDCFSVWVESMDSKGNRGLSFRVQRVNAEGVIENYSFVF